MTRIAISSAVAGVTLAVLSSLPLLLLNVIAPAEDVFEEFEVVAAVGGVLGGILVLVGLSAVGLGAALPRQPARGITRRP
jgi:hypothetical protein